MSKRLEEIAEEVLDGVFGKVPHSPQYKTLVMLGYEQAEKDTIERAWEWLTSQEGERTFDDFRKAMEEEQ